MRLFFHLISLLERTTEDTIYMTYDAFKELICKRLKDRLPADTALNLQQFYKNNGLKLDGLTISDSSSNISPTIFLNYYYDIRNHFPDFDAICQDILLAYQQNKCSKHISADFFTDYKQLKKRLAFRLINYNKNKELLQAVPHVRFLDLAIVFYCLLQVSSESNATILIHSRHLNLWNITAEQLYEQASQTTPILLPYDFRSMSEVLMQALGPDTSQSQDSTQAPLCPMYVLTNSRKIYGAGCILYPRVLDKLAKQLDADLYILPSSIHETILLPATSTRHPEELAEIVTDINQTELAVDEVLSDHIYFYSRSGQKLQLCT